MAVKIDNNQYSDDDLIEVKVKLNLPYMTSAAGYENLSGEINIHGNHHNYVKRKVSQDTLYLLCLPNNKRNQLNDASEKYAAETNDFDGSHKNDNQVKKSVTFNQFQEEPPSYVINAPVIMTKQIIALTSIHLPDSFVETIGKPPRSDS
ncbi:MAG: hypothetical protein EOO02_16855 [Chitinophagaceae bacterium]|nr:MAG: hypothetical protein EOO02_16855 [Chitinophagaceae bacterium]